MEKAQHDSHCIIGFEGVRWRIHKIYQDQDAIVLRLITDDEEDDQIFCVLERSRINLKDYCQGAHDWLMAIGSPAHYIAGESYAYH